MKLLCYILLTSAAICQGAASVLNAGSSSYFNERKKALKNETVTFRPQPKWSKIDEVYYKNPRPYTHNFTLLINEPHLCSQHHRVFLLYAIRTIYSHLGRREVLRKTLSEVPYDDFSKEIVIKHVFLFAKTNNFTLDALIHAESKMYRDIIQEDFMESYGNLSLKTIMAWKWITEYCANVEYVMVMNDEAFVDQYKMVPFLRYDLSLGFHQNHFAVCYNIGDKRATLLKMLQVNRLDHKILFRGKYYPKYCHGVGYVAHIDVINKLYFASLSNHHEMPDDAWIGVLAEKLNIAIPNQRNLFELWNPLKHFSSSNYPSSAVMVAVTDTRKNKGHEVEIARKLKSSLEQHRNLKITTKLKLGWQDNKKNIMGEARMFLHLEKKGESKYLLIISLQLLVLFFFGCKLFFPKRRLFRCCATIE